MSARRHFPFGTRAFGVRELAPAFTVSISTPKPATQRPRPRRTAPFSVEPLLPWTTLRVNDRSGDGLHPQKRRRAAALQSVGAPPKHRENCGLWRVPDSVNHGPGRATL